MLFINLISLNQMTRQKLNRLNILVKGELILTAEPLH